MATVGANKALIAKQTAEGEQINIEVQAETEEELEAAISRTLRFLDTRMLEMNLRVVRSNAATKGLPPEGQLAVHQIVETLHGRRPITAAQAAGMVAEALEEKKVDVTDTEAVQAVVEKVKDNIVQFGKRPK